MTRKTTSKRAALLIGIALLPVCVTFSHAGSGGQASLGGVEAQAEFEIAQRRELAGDFAPQAMQRGTEALAVRDYEKAFSEYRAALDALPDAPEIREIRKIALDGFTKAAMGLAEQRIAEGRWEDAQTTVDCLLQYNPDYQPARRLLTRLQSPDYFNKTVTPGFVSKVEQVKKLLVDGQGLYDSGRFAQAMDKYEEVLRIDRFNIAARRGMEQVNEARTRVADAAYNDTRASMVTAVDKSWEMPLRRNEMGIVSQIEQPVMSARSIDVIKERLAKNLISVKFDRRTIRQALAEVQEKAQDINIVYKAPPQTEDAIVSDLELNNVPVLTVIEYLTKLVDLKYKVEPYAVLIVPPDAVVEEMIVQTFAVGPNFLKDLPSSAGASDVGEATEGTVVGVDAKSALEGAGVKFQPGAMAEFIPSSSKLIVKNTRENIDLVANLVESLNPALPSQVEIESKFVEVTQNNLKELGFDWLLGQFALAGGSGVFGGGGTAGGQFNSSQNFPVNYPGGVAGDANNPLVPVGINPLTGGNRSGAAAITANAVDALLLGNPVTGPASGVLALAGVFTNPQFQVVLRALNQKKGIDVLSAPKVTTKSGQSATIEIVREFRYPEEYDPPQIPQSTGIGRQPITPATPTSFQMKPVGVTLAVVPNVDPEKKLIDLELKPTVNEFEGFINYGSPIYNRNVLVTENYINYPVFSQRQVETTVVLYDGQVAVIGGLLREDVQKVADKTPILGDIPLAGALFRSQADQHIKRNLLIFVQASLVDPAGQPLAAMSPMGGDMSLDPGVPRDAAPLEPPLP